MHIAGLPHGQKSQEKLRKKKKVRKRFKKHQILSVQTY